MANNPKNFSCDGLGKVFKSNADEAKNSDGKHLVFRKYGEISFKRAVKIVCIKSIRGVEGKEKMIQVIEHYRNIDYDIMVSELNPEGRNRIRFFNVLINKFLNGKTFINMKQLVLS